MAEDNFFMKEPSLIRLDLRAPLLYVETPGLVPFAYNRAAGPDQRQETLFCFDIDPAQSLNFEPDRERFLGALVFAGQGAEGGCAEQSPAAEYASGIVQLPAGLYLFAQKREALGREDCVDMTIEQQKDGLWERLKPENRLYVRYLFEDGSPVTQLFRPFTRDTGD
jgi:hypothetical protein